MLDTQIISLPSRASTSRMVDKLKNEEQDFEFYPTTHEIIADIKADIRNLFYVRDGEKIGLSVLDCGAGDGRVLNNLTEGNKYAIEKSQPLLSSYAADVFIVGTDFHQQTLIDKKVDIVFSNPPYGEYVEWAYKIITEANATCVYLVIPTRWKEDENIQLALDSRKARFIELSERDFLSADRSARAKVSVLRIELGAARTYGRNEPRIDPFDVWFDSNFPIDALSGRASDYKTRDLVKNDVVEKVKNAGEVIQNDGLVNVLERFYQRDMANLMANYKKLAGLDPVLLKELNVEVRAVKEALKLKIESHKSTYWQELFDNLETITGRLSSSSRESMLNKLQSHTHVDFSVSNAHAVALWVVKNANNYFDSQLITLVERMTEKANVIMYASNQRTFKDEDWRYRRSPDGFSHFKLDYRIVLSSMGGISGGYDAVNGLSKYSANFINDITVIAKNIGFDTEGLEKCHQFEWQSNKKQVFHFANHTTGKQEVLFEVRAFINGNLHIKMNQAFICKLNVEFGRLKGWLKSAEEAATELDITPEEAQRSFRSNVMLTANKLELLGFNKVA